MDDILVYLILLGSFTAGFLFNLNRRKQCVYSVRLTKIRAIILIVSALVFFSMVCYFGENLWTNYLLATAASLFLLSGVLAEGIHDKGILYLQGRGLPPIIKWESIKYANVKKSDYTVLTFIDKSYISNLLGLGGREKKQYYSLEDFEGIDEYIQKKVFSHDE